MRPGVALAARGRSRRRRRRACERAHPRCVSELAESTTPAWAVPHRRGTVPLPRVVAKPVRSRHSPATVSAPTRARVRSPTHGACSNLREKGRQDRATHRLDPSFDPRRSEGFAIRRDPSEPIPPEVSRVPVVLLAHSRRAAVARCRRSSRPSSWSSPPAPAPRRPRRRRARPSPARPPAATPAASPEPTAAAAFPVTLTDDEGTAVRSRPSRRRSCR